MQIVSFRIENFRNLRFAECTNVPEFMVICGGNGCGKSALRRSTLGNSLHQPLVFFIEAVFLLRVHSSQGEEAEEAVEAEKVRSAQQAQQADESDVSQFVDPA